MVNLSLQHLKDHLDLSLSAMCYIMTSYPEEKDEEQMRRSLGRYGLTGKQQVHEWNVKTVFECMLMWKNRCS